MANSFSGSAALAENLTPPADENRRLFFRGAAGTLLGIQLINMLLILCTLGMYLFWAKVRVRGYVLGQTELDGDRFAYHGTGRELLIGSVKAGLIFGLPITLLNNLPVFLNAGAWIKTICVIIAYAIMVAFLPFAIVGTRRYRLSRSSWRGIRFSFRGRALRFFRLSLRSTLLRVVTIGLYSPFWAVQKYDFLTSNSYFGNRKFDFNGRGRELLRSFLVAVLLMLPTLGLYGFWYQAKKMRYLTEHTSFGNARLTCTVTGGELCRLQVVNFLIVIATLGLALPWATVRNFRYWYDHVGLVGPIDFAAIEQDAQSATATAEGLAGFLDLDFSLGA
jgi:uncharacterized membrane protein YjgN (DUF898 family)